MRVRGATARNLVAEFVVRSTTARLSEDSEGLFSLKRTRGRNKAKPNVTKR